MSPNTIPPEPDPPIDLGVGKTIRRRVVKKITTDCGCGACLDCEFGDGRKTTVEQTITMEGDPRHPVIAGARQDRIAAMLPVIEAVARMVRLGPRPERFAIEHDRAWSDAVEAHRKYLEEMGHD